MNFLDVLQRNILLEFSELFNLFFFIVIIIYFYRSRLVISFCTWSCLPWKFIVIIFINIWLFLMHDIWRIMSSTTKVVRTVNIPGIFIKSLFFVWSEMSCWLLYWLWQMRFWMWLLIFLGCLDLITVILCLYFNWCIRVMKSSLYWHHSISLHHFSSPFFAVAFTLCWFSVALSAIFLSRAEVNWWML